MGSPTNNGSMWPALDGLRGLAVAAVVLFHTTLFPFSNGSIGVDLFFVLSGFLITYLLLAEHASTGRVRLSTFYGRRMLRLYPALVALTVGAVVMSLIAQRRVVEVGRGAVAALLYLSNIWIFSGHDTYLLQHTWSLGIEAQFYAVWPLLLLCLLAGWSGRIAVGAILAASAIVLLAPGLPWVDARGALAGSLSRASGLPVGALLAWIVASRNWRRSPMVGPGAATALGLCLTALLLLIVSAPFIPRPILEAPLNPAVLVSTALIALLVAGASGLAGRLLATASMRWLGRRSYGVYLYHFPLLSLALHQLPQRLPLIGRAATGIAATMLVSALSYALLETPFLKLKVRLASPIATVVPA